MAKKIQIIESLLIEDLAEKGRGVGRAKGKVVFVPKAVPGDIVDVRVYKKRRSSTTYPGIVKSSKSRTLRNC